MAHFFAVFDVDKFSKDQEYMKKKQFNRKNTHFMKMRSVGINREDKPKKWNVYLKAGVFQSWQIQRIVASNKIGMLRK